MTRHHAIHTDPNTVDHLTLLNTVTRQSLGELINHADRRTDRKNNRSIDRSASRQMNDRMLSFMIINGEKGEEKQALLPSKTRCSNICTSSVRQVDHHSCQWSSLFNRINIRFTRKQSSENERRSGAKRKCCTSLDGRDVRSNE
jgi:hypothetical protein